jgi:hypothetical protein
MRKGKEWKEKKGKCMLTHRALKGASCMLVK